MRPIVEAGAAGWPLAATLAMVLAGERVRAGRRRLALNRSLHELRRPLQALVFASSHPAPDSSHSPLVMALAALADLDRELNGASGGDCREPKPLAGLELATAAVRRWRSRAALAGATIELRWSAAGSAVRGDEEALSRALDNLVVNAIDHGGPRIAVEGHARRGRLLITVADDGRDHRPESRRGTPAELIARLTGRRRHGHGLEAVREVAAAHGGRFALRRSERGSLAVLELPLAQPPAADAA